MGYAFFAHVNLRKCDGIETRPMRIWACGRAMMGKRACNMPYAGIWLFILLLLFRSRMTIRRKKVNKVEGGERNENRYAFCAMVHRNESR